MSNQDILTAVLGGAWIAFGLLLLSAKLKIVIVYRDDEQPAPWSEKDEEEPDNYVKPLEVAKPPTLVETPKRKRGRPRKVLATPPAR